MRFPVVFKRHVGGFGAGFPLGGDEVPGDGLGPNQVKGGNVLASRFNSINGWPFHRVVVAYKAPKPGATVDAELYLYEDQLQKWFKVGPAQKVQEGVLAFFDCVSLLDRPHVGADGSGTETGSAAYLLIVRPNGNAAEGEHAFAMAPDLTTAG